MKLDSGKAWTNAVEMISGNRDAVLAIAGLFFFLPPFALWLLLPDAMVPQEPPVSDTADFNVLLEAMQAQMAEQVAKFWWVTVLLTAFQWFGMLALMSLFIDRSRPTVGDAMKSAGRGLVPFIAAQLLVVLAIALVVLIATQIGVAGAILLLISFPVMIYVFVKVTLLPPVITIENQLNPLNAIKRSWQLTKGNSLSLFFFLLLLTIALGVVALLVSLVFSAGFAAVGGTIEQIGNGFVESVLSAAIAVSLLAAVAAVYRQLAGPSDAEVSETFE
ncbi:MAG: hypothetical protein AAGK02_11350 [Pseudomonadota bacterium]